MDTRSGDRCGSRSIQHDDEMDEDMFEGLCIEKGHVRGLDVQSTDGEDRCGELIVESMDRMQHTFAIRAAHQIPIPEDTYTLLGSGECLGYADPGHPLFEACAGNNTSHTIDRHHLAVGRRLPDGRFKKVSVVMMDAPWRSRRMQSLEDLGIAYV